MPSAMDILAGLYNGILFKCSGKSCYVDQNIIHIIGCNVDSICILRPIFSEGYLI